jgi:hypothetical protein
MHCDASEEHSFLLQGGPSKKRAVDTIWLIMWLSALRWLLLSLPFVPEDVCDILLRNMYILSELHGVKTPNDLVFKRGL